MLTLSESTWEWNFPGGGVGLAVTALIAAALIIIGYRSTLFRLPLRSRLGLTALRLAVLGLALLVLARPTHVRRDAPDEMAKRKVAVIVDDSGSANTRSAMGKTRHEQATDYLRRHLAPLEDDMQFGHFRFSEAFRREAEEPATPVDQKTVSARPTHLYASIAAWSSELTSEGYEAVICLTDGVDSTTGPRVEAERALAASGLRHAFIPLDAPLPPTAYAQIVRLEVEPSAAVGSQSPVDMLINASPEAEATPLKLVVKDDQGATVIEQEVAPGSERGASRGVRFDLPVVDESPREYEATVLSGGAVLSSARWVMRGAGHRTPRILLYHGSPDAGTRHFRGVFDHKEHAALTVRYHPGALKQGTAADPEFPGLTALKAFDAVVLVNVRADQLGEPAQSALRQYTEEGGGVLLAAGDPPAAGSFARSPLAAGLPVVFDPARSDWAPLTATQQKTPQRKTSAADLAVFQNQSQMDDGGMASTRLGRQPSSPIFPFVLTREGEVHAIFRDASSEGQALKPMYQNLIAVQEVKPGAQVLATADDGTTPLLAIHRYGRGRVVVLLTDTLWRWRLATDSGRPGYDNFWRQLINWTAGEDQSKPMWMVRSIIQPTDKLTEADLFLPAASGHRAGDVRVRLQSGETEWPLTLGATERPEEYRIAAQLEPGRLYRLLAEVDGKPIASAYIAGRMSEITDELRRLEADLATLQRLASASGGVVVRLDESFDWRNWLPKAQAQPVREIRRAAWHHPALFILLLGLIVFEMVMRRVCRLA